MHVGATIRVLRVGAGVGLRDLAQRIGVSTAYLSRVENGHDGPPTADRLEAIARELGLPAALLLDVAGRMSPFLTSYMEEVPAAGAFFLEVARRRLGPAALDRLRAVIDREHPAPSVRPVPRSSLVELLAPERIVLRVSARRVVDVLDLLATRLADDVGSDPRSVSVSLGRDAEPSSMLGGGVMVPQAFVAGLPARAALVTLAKPLKAETPDGVPLRLFIALQSEERGFGHLGRLAEVARLTRHGLAERLAEVSSEDEAVAVLAALGAGA